MSAFTLDRVAGIRAERDNIDRRINLWITSVEGHLTLVALDCEESLYPTLDLLVRAINSAARAAEPRPEDTEAEIVILPRRNGLGWGDPKRPLGGDGPGAA